MHTETLIDTLELWGGGKEGEGRKSLFFFSVRVDLESSSA